MKSALIVGAGFIGLEMAENLKQAGMSVTVVEQANQVMGTMDYSMAVMVHNYLRSQGVNLHVNESVTSFESRGKQVEVQLKSSKSILSDMVILSIGVRPETRLAKKAGLLIGELGGIKVNDYMQTSDPNIYALGDAVEVKNMVTGTAALIPLAGPANKQARIVADNIIAGNKKVYQGSIGTSIAKIFDMSVASAGASERLLQREGFQFFYFNKPRGSHAGYYPERCLIY